MRRAIAALLIVAALATAAIVATAGRRPSSAPRPPALTIGLFGTLPILWRETESAAELLVARAPRHWAARVLEERGRVVPLDLLTKEALDRVDLVVMAQPRPLAPTENVALERFARRGRLLLFADPLLTAGSVFPLGDRRRPQGAVLLSPIMARWGLRLAFDEDQPADERWIALRRSRLPVRMAGRLGAARGQFACDFDSGRVVARCGGREGGRLVAVADAALLEEGAAEDDRAAALRELLDSLIAPEAR